MNNPTSYELCKKLFEVSAWEDTSRTYWLHPERGLTSSTEKAIYGYNEEPWPGGAIAIPDYALEYLLDKLPYFVKLNDARGTFQLFMLKLSNGYHIGYNKPETGKWLASDDKRYVFLSIHDQAARDSAIKVCLELIKQEIIPGRSK